MNVQPDQWLADYERKIVTMWTVAAFVAYGMIVCGVIGMVMIRDAPMDGTEFSVQRRSPDGTERTPAPGASSAPRWRSPLAGEGVQGREEVVVGSVPESSAPGNTVSMDRSEEPVQ